jgi:triacylglycerol lipase
VDLPGVECRYFLAVSTTVPAQVLGLRGTSNLKNALLDVQITDELDTDLSMRLHRGFAVSSLAVLADVRPRLDKARPVRLVGHSLGGAQAVILGLWLQKEGFIVERVVTFGQPQLTNARGGGKAAGLPLLRVVNDRDLVPFMPPAEIVPFLKSYRPFGPEVVLLEGPSYYRPVSRAPDLPRLRAFVDALQAGGTPPEIQEHGIAVYAFRLSTKADAAQEVPAP